MTQGGWFLWELRTTLQATLPAVEEFTAELRKQTAGTVSAQHGFAAELLAREVLNNAVVHGCQNNPDRRIRCLLRLRRDSLTIAVADDGSGFNWRAAWSRSAELSATSGRGMEILRKYATRVRFNDEGSAVMIVRRYCQGAAK